MKHYVEVSENYRELGGYFVRVFTSLSPAANPMLTWHFTNKHDAIEIAKDLAKRFNAVFYQ